MLFNGGSVFRSSSWSGTRSDFCRTPEKLDVSVTHDDVAFANDVTHALIRYSLKVVHFAKKKKTNYTPFTSL